MKLILLKTVSNEYVVSRFYLTFFLLFGSADARRRDEKELMKTTKMNFFSSLLSSRILIELYVAENLQKKTSKAYLAFIFSLRY